MSPRKGPEKRSMLSLQRETPHQIPDTLQTPSWKQHQSRNTKTHNMKHCLTCSKPFNENAPHQKYCSKTCRISISWQRNQRTVSKLLCGLRYRQKNRALLNEKSKKYYRDNIEKCRKLSLARYYQKKMMEITYIEVWLKENVLIVTRWNRFGMISAVNVLLK